jgi:hypothetical protein
MLLLHAELDKSVTRNLYQQVQQHPLVQLNLLAQLQELLLTQQVNLVVIAFKFSQLETMHRKYLLNFQYTEIKKTSCVVNSYKYSPLWAKNILHILLTVLFFSNINVCGSFFRSSPVGKKLNSYSECHFCTL